MTSIFTLTSIRHAEIGKAEFLDVLLQSYALGARLWLDDERIYRGKILPRVGAGVFQSLLKEMTVDVVRRTAHYDPRLPEYSQDGAQADQHSA